MSFGLDHTSGKTLLQWGLGFLAEEIHAAVARLWIAHWLQWGLGFLAEEMAGRPTRSDEEVALQWGLGFLAEEITATEVK